MKNAAFVVAVGAAWMAAGTASAAPLGPNVKKTSITESEVLQPSTKYTESLLQKKMPTFSKDRTYRTADGSTITGREFLEVANTIAAAAEKAGCKLGTGASCNFVAAETKMGKAQLERVANLAALKAVPRRLIKPGKLLKGERAAKDTLGFSWSNEWGTRSRAAVYVGAEFGNGGSTRTSSCGGAAYAGVYVFNTKREVLRLEGEVSAGASVEASAGLYVLGDAVWTRTAGFDAPRVEFEKSFKVTKSFSYWGIITINLKAETTAGAYLSGTLRGTSAADSYTCTIGLTPGVKARLGGSAEVAILGYGDISAAAVGVEADVTLADISLPIAASAAAAKSGSSVKFTESLKVELAMKYLRGSLDAYFKTVFPLDGESILDWDKDKFTFTLLEFDGYEYNRPLFDESKEQTL